MVRYLSIADVPSFSSSMTCTCPRQASSKRGCCCNALLIAKWGRTTKWRSPQPAGRSGFCNNSRTTKRSCRQLLNVSCLRHTLRKTRPTAESDTCDTDRSERFDLLAISADYLVHENPRIAAATQRVGSHAASPCFVSLPQSQKYSRRLMIWSIRRPPARTQTSFLIRTFLSRQR